MSFFDPFSPLDFNRSLAELEQFLLFSVFVPGKSARTTIKKLRSFLEGREHDPFVFVGELIEKNLLAEALKSARVGQYSRLLKCLPRLIELNPRTCAIEDLEALPGIGPKSARFFILFTRENARVACLDRHILRYMRDSMGISDAPEGTPQNLRQYRDLEKKFIAHADELGRSIAELDFEIWESRAV